MTGEQDNRQAERRKHRRFELSCPIRLIDDAGGTVAAARTLDISDGGVFIPLPPDSLPKCRKALKVGLSVPRQTANTFMLEEFSCEGRVLRHQPLADGRSAGVAIQFAKPMKLSLEV